MSNNIIIGCESISKPKVVSLFAGIGGIDIAFKEAGFKIIWANEMK